MVNPLLNHAGPFVEKLSRPSCLTHLHINSRQFHIRWIRERGQIIREGVAALAASYRFPGLERFDRADGSPGSWHREVRSHGTSSLLRAMAASTTACVEGSES
jgi:hypothetical protein